MTRVNTVGTKSFHDRLIEHALELAAMDAELRDVVAGRDAPRLVPDRLAATGHIDLASRANANAIERGQQAEGGERFDRVRLHVDADAKLAHLRGQLEDLRLDSDLVQCQRRGQPADARSRDHDPHGWPPHRCETILALDAG